MSWQAFVDTSLVGTKHVTKGAIISIAGDSAWASSPDLTIEPAEMLAIVNIVKKTEGAEAKAYAEGLYIGGVRYVLTKNDGDIYARSGRDGVAITAAESCVVIGIHDETQIAGSATIAVAALADHLKKTGY